MSDSLMGVEVMKNVSESKAAARIEERRASTWGDVPSSYFQIS